MSTQDFTSVRSLSSEDQRGLLRSPDPLERLWAAWALAESLGGSALPEVRSSIELDQDPGVRRHLIVILAGHKETALLRALASFDPDPIVRGTALRYAIRIESPLSAETEELVQALLDEATSPIVIEALLSEATPDLVSAQSLRPLLSSSNRSNRRLAHQALLRLHPADPSLQEALEYQALIEADPDLQEEMVKSIFQAGRLAGALSLVAAQPIENALRILKLIEELNASIPWIQASPVLGLGDPRADLFFLGVTPSERMSPDLASLLLCILHRSSIICGDTESDLEREAFQAAFEVRQVTFQRLMPRIREILEFNLAAPARLGLRTLAGHLNEEATYLSGETAWVDWREFEDGRQGAQGLAEEYRSIESSIRSFLRRW